MSESSRAALRRLLVGRYADLKKRLTRRLGSADLAGEVLQDAWVRLEEATPSDAVRVPEAYLLRMAYNIALKRRRAGQGSVSLDDARRALDLADDAPGPAAVAESRSELARLAAAAAELTPRQRDILFASRLEQVPLGELAVRHGISQRWVEKELRHAVLHCARRLDRKVVQRFGPRPREDQ